MKRIPLDQALDETGDWALSFFGGENDGKRVKPREFAQSLGQIEKPTESGFGPQNLLASAGEMPITIPQMRQPASPKPTLNREVAQKLIESPTTSPELKAVVAKKFDLGEYSDENRKALLEQSQPSFGDKAGAVLATLGAGFMGQNAAAAGEAKLNAARQRGQDAVSNFDKGRAGKIQEYQLDRQLGKDSREDAILASESDPNSEESKMAQQLAQKMGYKGDISAITAERFKTFSPVMAKTYELEQNKLNQMREQGNKDRSFSLETMKAKGEGGKRTVDDKKMGSFVTEGLRGAQGMRSALQRGDNTFSLVGSNDFTRNLDRMAENFGRMQSGGAINKDEEARFMRMAPRPTDSAEQQQKKLDDLETMFRERAQIYNVDLGKAEGLGTPVASAGPKPSWAR